MFVLSAFDVQSVKSIFAEATKRSSDEKISQNYNVGFAFDLFLGIIH